MRCTCGRGCDAIDRERADDVTNQITQAATDLLALVADEENRFLIGGPREPYLNAVNHLARVALSLGYALEPERRPMTAQEQRRARADRSNRRHMREVFDRDGWQCVRCGDHRALTVDHIIAVENGGDDEVANKQTLCKSCNSAKGTV